MGYVSGASQRHLQLASRVRKQDTPEDPGELAPDQTKFTFIHCFHVHCHQAFPLSRRSVCTISNISVTNQTSPPSCATCRGPFDSSYLMAT